MSTYAKEARATLALALPIVVGQVSQMLMGITDSVMIGHVGTLPLAAAAFTNSVFGVFFVVGIGVLVPVAVLVSRAHGAGREHEAGEWLRHGVTIALAASGGGSLLMALLALQLHRFGQPPEVLAEVQPYYLIIAASLVPTLLFQAFRQFGEALGRPWPPMLMMLGGVGLNVVLNWILIYGHLGAPAMGLEGAGWATLIARTAGVFMILAWLTQAAAFRIAWPRVWFRGLQRARFREMLHLGVPAAGMLLFESGAFSAAALMMGWLGAVPLAAHQIALSCAALTFMFPLGLSMAVSMRLGKAVGEGRREVLRPIGFGALGISVAIMGGFALIFAIAGRPLAAAFVADAGVIDLAARLLVVAAIFQLFDGGQVVGAGALRGLADVKIPAIITFAAYWLIALPGGYFAGVRGPLGPLGVWAALAAGLAFAAVFLALRFARLTR
ncbi:MAG TPA: MATE family efflux transporter [Opitutaceae bacterium]